MAKKYLITSHQKRLFMATIAALAWITASAPQVSARSIFAQKASPAPVTLTIPTHESPSSNDQLTQAACFHVHEIRIQGLSLVDKETVRAKIQPMAYHCLSSDAAYALANAISDIHSDAGFVTTKAHLSTQEIHKSTRLDIHVVTGHIEKIIYQENERDAGYDFPARISKASKPIHEADGPWGFVNAISDLLHTIDHPLDRFQMLDGRKWPTLKPWTATGIKAGEALNSDEIQRGVDVFKSLPSNNTTYKIIPGETPAMSQVILTNDRRDSFTLTAGYEVNGVALNNRGNTIDKRLRLEFTKDNLIGVNDKWGTIFAYGPDNTEFKGNFSVPWRRFSISMMGEYFKSVTAGAPTINYHYLSVDANAYGTYLLESARTHNTKLEGGFGWRKVDRHINSYLLETRQITISRLGFLRSHYMTTAADQEFLQGREISYGAGITRGLPMLGATHDAPNLGMREPHAQFWKLDGKAKLKQRLRNLGTLSMEAKAQWSECALYSGDQLSLGSLETIRGFNNTAAKVDRGAFLRTEFAPTVPVDKMMTETDKNAWPFLNDMLRATEPYVFVDAGQGRNITTQRDLTRASFGGGVRMNYGRTKIDFSFAHRAIERGTPRFQHAPEIYFSINTKML